MHTAQALAFYGELRKHASVMAGVHKILGSRSVGMGAGVGALIGAGVGGVQTARKEYNDLRDAGASRLVAGLAAVPSGLLMGAPRGALTGGAIGAGVGAVAHRFAPELAGNLAEKSEKLRDAMLMGQRQMHGYSGSTPEVPGATSRLDALKRIGTVADGPMSRAQAVAESHANAGLTSIPGLAKGLLKNPIDTLRKEKKMLWDAAPIENKLLMGATAVPMLMGANQISQLPEEQRHQEYGRMAAGLPLLVAGSGLPMLAQTGLQNAVGTSGALAGRAAHLIKTKLARPAPAVAPEVQEIQQ